MKNHLLFVLGFLFLFASFTSCEKETLFTISQTTITIPDTGGAQELSLTANKSWKAVVDQPWCTVSPSSGEENNDLRVTVTCEANNTFDDRECTISFSCAETVLSVKVNQPTTLTNSYIQFADLYAETVCLNKYDLNKDGKLSLKEAAEVNAIESRFFGNYASGVTSFDEFQFFINVTIVPSDAFSNCSNLERITLPEGITEIGKSAFGWCHKLKKMNFPSNLKYIREYGVFATALEEIVLPEGLLVIEESGIAANSIKTITIPSSVTTFGWHFLRECNSLESIISNFSSSDQRCLIKDGALIAFAPSGIKEYTTPSGVKTITSFGLANDAELRSLTISEGVQEIKMSSIYVDRGALESLSLPSTVLTVSDFGGAKDVYCKASTPPLYSSMLNIEILKQKNAYVPKNSIELYKESALWSKANLIGWDY